MSIEQFLAQILDTVVSFGGLPWTLKVAAIITLLIGSLKVSAARPLWDRLGAFKAFASPVLALALGIITLGAGPESVTLKGVSAYLFAGAGAIILHELLDAVKSLPGVGAAYVGAINLIQGFLRKPAEAPKPQ
jgi:hypothetical protein